MSVLRSGTLALLATLAAAGCDSPTKPPEENTLGGLAITLSASGVQVSAVRRDPEVALRCQAQLTAQVSGREPAAGRWTGGILRFHAGNSQSATDSVSISQAKVREIWSWDEGIAPGTRSGTLDVDLPGPGAAEVEFRYTSGPRNTPGSASVRLACGGEPAAGGAPSGRVSVSPTAGLQPGDTLTVSFFGQGDANLWKSQLRISGAWQRTLSFPEQTGRTLYRTLQIPIPDEVALGKPVVIHLALWDAALRQSAPDSAVTGPLVDTRPPSVRIEVTRFCTPTCHYAVDESIPFRWNGRDNHMIRWFVYEVGSPVILRDSVPVTSRLITGANVRIRADWGRTPVLRAQVRDSVGNASAIYSTPPGSITVYPAVEYPQRSVQLQGRYLDAHLDQRRNRLYVLRADQPEVDVYAVPGLERLPGIAIPGRAVFAINAPGGLELTPTGDTLLVALTGENAIGVVDLTKPAPSASKVPITAARLEDGYRTSGIRVTRDGMWLANAVNGAARASMVLKIDPRTGEQSVLAKPDGSFLWQRPVRTGDYSRTVVVGKYNGGGGCARFYEVAQGALGPCVTLPNNQEQTYTNLTGTHFVDWRNIYDAGFRHVREVQSPVMLFPRGDSAYVWTDSGIDVRDLDTWTPRLRIKVPAMSPDTDGPWLIPAADGRYLVLLGWVSGQVGTRIVTMQAR